MLVGDDVGVVDVVGEVVCELVADVVGLVEVVAVHREAVLRARRVAFDEVDLGC